MCEKNNYNGRRIDPCLIPILHEINSFFPYQTLLSCCGHGKYKSSIVVLNKQTGIIFEWYSKQILKNTFKNGKRRTHFYTKDSDGYYYLSELKNKL